MISHKVTINLYILCTCMQDLYHQWKCFHILEPLYHVCPNLNNRNTSYKINVHDQDHSSYNTV